MDRIVINRREAVWALIGCGAAAISAPSRAAAPVRRAGVLFEAPDEYREIFDQTLKGIDASFGDEVQRFHLRPGITEGEIKSWLASDIDAWVALGRRARDLIQSVSTRVPGVVGLTYFSPKATPNLSGVSLEYSADAVLPVIQSVLPQHDRIHVVYVENRDEWLIEQLTQSARMRGFIVRASAVTSLSEASDLYLTILKHGDPRSDLLWLLGGDELVSRVVARRLIETSLEYKFPIFSSRRGGVDYGFLLGGEPDYFEIGKQIGDALRNHASNGVPQAIPTSHIKSALNVRVARLLGLNVTAVMRRSIDILVADD